MRIGQKNYNKVLKTVYVWFKFLSIRSYDAWFFYKWLHWSEIKLSLKLVAGQIFFVLQLYDGTMEGNKMA